jgi:hypothetical protein
MKMTLLNYIKKNLRIDEEIDDFDDEIQTLIDAAKTDLETFSIKEADEEDPLVKSCITFFVKANFGIENKDHEKNMKIYEMIRSNLNLTKKYNPRNTDGGNS